MLLYISRRLVWTVLVVIVVLFVTFLVFFKLPNGDPALRFAGKSPTPEQLELIRHRLHLDKPFYEEFGYFVKTFVTGDENGWPGLGYSYGNYVSVRSEVIQRAPRTLWLIAGAADDLARARRRDRRALGGQAPDADRPPGDGLRALRDLGARLLARPDGAVPLLEEARPDGRLGLHAARRRVRARGSRT